MTNLPLRLESNLSLIERLETIYVYLQTPELNGGNHLYQREAMKLLVAELPEILDTLKAPI